MLSIFKSLKIRKIENEISNLVVASRMATNEYRCGLLSSTEWEKEINNYDNRIILLEKELAAI